MEEEKEQNHIENCAFVSLKVLGFDKFTLFHFGSVQFLHVKVLLDTKCQRIP